MRPRLRYVADREGNISVKELPVSDFSETNHAADVGQWTVTLDARGQLVEQPDQKKSDPNVYDDAGHAIGNYR